MAQNSSNAISSNLLHISQGQEHINRNNSNLYVIKKDPFKKKDSDCLFEIFGFKIHLDDIIIVGLLFILYKEGVKDEMLYIALVLLLLS